MGRLARFVNGIYLLRRKINSEETFLRRTLRKRSFRGATLLDVGCGFSRFCEIIAEQGIEYVGVDINPDTVKDNRAVGKTVYTDSEFQSLTYPYDVLLLSHIIEHFSFSELVLFLNKYLLKLKVGGIVILFTPLYHRGFYDDFDHVKPYNPGALRQVFCKSSAQTRGFGLLGDYEEIEIWFKHDSLWHSHRVGSWTHLFSLPLSLIGSLSCGLFGRLTGYGMVLRKVG